MTLSAQNLGFPSQQRWSPQKLDLSASNAIQLTRYDASRLVLIPVSSAERDGKKLVAGRPVRVAVEVTATGVTAENEGLQIYATGSTPEEAVEDFRSQLIELFLHYSSLSADDVIGEARGLRRVFLENFKLI